MPVKFGYSTAAILALVTSERSAQISGTAVLPRRLSALDGAALVVSNVVGVGIFTTPGIVAALAPNPVVMLALWVAGGVLALAGASAYAELAALRPHAGGEYVYLRDAFGPLFGFLTGWTSFVAGFSGAMAAGAVGFAVYLSAYFPHALGDQPWFAVHAGFTTVTVTPRILVAMALVMMLALLHARGLGPGRRLQNGLAWFAVAVLAVFIVAGFARGTGSLAHLSESAPLHWTTCLLALVPIMFTYSGWNAAAYLAEEVRDPRRTLPRALLAGTAAVVALYLLLNVLYLYALAPAGLAHVIHAGRAAAEALFGQRVADFFTPLVLVSLAASISAMTLAGPRVYFAMARDGLFLPVAARIHPRFRTPAAAILLQAAWTCLLILTGTFEQLLIYTGFAVVLFSGAAVLSLFVLRRRTGERTNVALGYPVLPALFVLASAAMLINAIAQRPGPSLTGAAIIAAGAPLFLWARMRQRGAAA